MLTSYALQTMVDALPIAACVFTGPEHIITAVNQQMLAIWAKDVTVIQQTLYNAIPEIREQGFSELLTTVFSTGEEYRNPLGSALLIENGQEVLKHFDFSFKPLRDDDGTIYGVVNTAIDTSERVVAEKSLKAVNNELIALNEEQAAVNEELTSTIEQLVQTETAMQKLYDDLAASEGLLNQFIQQAPAGIAIYTGPKLIIHSINQAAQSLLPKREFLGRSVFDALPEIVGTPVAGNLLHAYQTGEVYQQSDVLIPVARVEGGELEERYFNLSYIPHRNAEGTITGLFSFTIETTEQVKARREVIDLNDRISIAVDAGNFGYTEVQLATGQMRCNAAFKRAYGRTPDQELTYPDMFAAMLPEYREEVRAKAMKARDENLLYRAEYPVRWPDGSVHWISAYGRARYDSKGNADRMVGLIKDITAEKQSEEMIINLNKSLREQEERLRLAVASANLGTWFMDVQTMAITFSDRLKQIFGYYLQDEIDFATAVNQIAESHREQVALAINAAITEGKSYDIEYPLVGYRDQQLRWVRATGKTFTSSNSDNASYFLGTIADITERKQDEQRKMDFIGIVSHELRSPLTSLNGYMQMLALKAKKTEDNMVLDIAAKAKRQVDKMSSMITGFLDVARMGETQIKLNNKAFDMADLVKAAEEESLATVTSHHVIYHPVEVTPVVADQDKIEQVLINFINNAVKYSPQGSTINVACITLDGWAHVSVADEGMGIPAKDLPHIFNRFYRVESESMKSVKGFGIGLYLCKEIIERHGGIIGVESLPEKGSTFWFRLPISN